LPIGRDAACGPNGGVAWPADKSAAKAPQKLTLRAYHARPGAQPKLASKAELGYSCAVYDQRRRQTSRAETGRSGAPHDGERDPCGRDKLSLAAMAQHMTGTAAKSDTISGCIGAACD
jgi:hypothetical protein